MNNDLGIQDLIEYENKIRYRYIRFISVFLLIGIALFIWVLIVFSGILFWNYSNNWAGLGLDVWIYLVSIIIAVIIIINLFLFFHYRSIDSKRIEMLKPQPEFINGKQVHVFTFPEDFQGGVFSKTYVNIDDHNLLRVRTVIVDPEDL